MKRNAAIIEIKQRRPKKAQFVGLKAEAMLDRCALTSIKKQKLK